MPQPKYTEHSPAPWKAVRDWEGCINLEDLDEDDREYFLNKPITQILSVPTDIAVVNAHDLFEFDNPYDYKLIEQAPELLRLLKIAVEIIDQTTGVDYSEGNGPLVQAIDAVIKAATTVE